MFVLGGFFCLVAIYLLLPGVEAYPYAAAGCGAFGALLVAAAVFSSDRVMERVEQLMTGWP